MNASSRRVGLLAGLIVLATWTAAAGQGVSGERQYVAVKAGANHEQAEDGLSGTSGAAGLAFGFSFSPSWSGEIELWLPDFLTISGGHVEHRDIAASFTVARSFGSARAPAFVLVGAGLARIEERRTICIADREPFPPSGTAPAVPTLVACSEPDVRQRQRERTGTGSAYIVGGLGIEVPLGRRLRLVPEVRVHAAAASVIVRPSVGVIVVF